MCHQTVSLIARAIEATGTPTISLSSARSITKAAGAPRGAFVNYPLGHTAGKPDDRSDQRAVVLGALSAAAQISEPGGIVDLLNTWTTHEGWQARATGGPDNGVSCATDGDSRRPRLDTPQYQSEADREAAEVNLS